MSSNTLLSSLSSPVTLNHESTSQNNLTGQAFNIEAERAVIGAILFDNEIFYKIGELKASHFYNPTHQKIFSCIDNLITAGRLASPVTVQTYLQELPEFNNNKNENYLGNLLEATPILSSTPEYAKLVYDLSVFRGLAQIGMQLNLQAQNIDEQIGTSTLIEEAEQALYSLAESGRFGQGFEFFTEPLNRALLVADAAKKRGGGISGISTGLNDLDKILSGLQKSDLLILAGRPSMGKTALATNIAVYAAQKGKYMPKTENNDKSSNPYQPATVAFFSLEMSSDQIAMRILSEFSAIGSEKIRRGEISDQDFTKLEEAASFLQSLSLHIDDTGGLSIAQLCARARRLKRQVGLDLIIVDYLQLIAGSKRKSDNRVNEITEITTNLKALAKELNVPIIALSQLSRKVEERDDKRPQLSDLRESGSIEQDADVVMFVFREEYYLLRKEPKEGTAEHEIWQEDINSVHGLADVIIGKQRHGPIGTVTLHFDANRTKFSNHIKNNYYPEIN